MTASTPPSTREQGVEAQLPLRLVDDLEADHPVAHGGDELGPVGLAQLFEHERVRGHPAAGILRKQRAEHPPGRFGAARRIGHRVEHVAGDEVVVDAVLGSGVRPRRSVHDLT